MPNREIKEANRTKEPYRAGTVTRGGVTKPLMAQRITKEEFNADAPAPRTVAPPRPIASTDSSARRVVGPASPEVRRQYMEADRQGSIAESQRQRAQAPKVEPKPDDSMARGLRTVLKPGENLRDRMRRSGAE